jgi:hypothetical protein
MARRLNQTLACAGIGQQSKLKLVPVISLATKARPVMRQLPPQRLSRDFPQCQSLARASSLELASRYNAPSRAAFLATLSLFFFVFCSSVSFRPISSAD